MKTRFIDMRRVFRTIWVLCCLGRAKVRGVRKNVVKVRSSVEVK